MGWLFDFDIDFDFGSAMSRVTKLRTARFIVHALPAFAIVYVLQVVPTAIFLWVGGVPDVYASWDTFVRWIPFWTEVHWLVACIAASAVVGLAAARYELTALSGTVAGIAAGTAYYFAGVGIALATESTLSNTAAAFATIYGGLLGGFWPAILAPFFVGALVRRLDGRQGALALPARTSARTEDESFEDSLSCAEDPPSLHKDFPRATRK